MVNQQDFLKNQGLHHHNLGKQAEQQKNYIRAKLHYAKSLDYFVKCSKLMKKSAKKEAFLKLITEQLTHAEYIKKLAVKQQIKQKEEEEALKQFKIEQTKRKFGGLFNKLNRSNSGNSILDSGSKMSSTKLKRSSTQDTNEKKIKEGNGDKNSIVTNDLIDKIKSEILDSGTKVTFDDVIGLEKVKQALFEMVIYPAKNPELFSGLIQPPKGLLLFGPPGNGKTLIAKAVACESNATFFSITAASLTSKVYGEGEKLMRALFQVAREKQPSIIFIDEIDSILSARKADEHSASRRLKTEFLTQLEGFTSDGTDKITVIGATNLPDALDSAVSRRFQRKIYVPCPDANTRFKLVKAILKRHNKKYKLKPDEQKVIIKETDGYSSSDLSNLVKDAALQQIRTYKPSQLVKLKTKDLGPLNFTHFKKALKNVKKTEYDEALYTKFKEEADD